jgi:hypothetical protein
MEKIMESRFQRLARLWRQPSTKRGLVGILGLCGIVLSPDQWEAITAAVALALSVIEIFRDEDKKGGAS